MLLFSSVVGVGLYFLFSKYGPQCEEIDLKRVENLLASNLFGQQQATKDIIHFLYRPQPIKIGLFYGSTGVGKTYAVQMILRDKKENAYKFTGINKNNGFKAEHLIGLNWCGQGYVVVDDLTLKDDYVARELNELVEYAIIFHVKITIILIYNCDEVDKNLNKGCDRDYESQLNGQFDSVKVKRQYVKFNHLEQDSLEKCIQFVSSKRLNQQKLKEISKEFNVTSDGCKGVHSKIKYKETKDYL